MGTVVSLPAPGGSKRSSTSLSAAIGSKPADVSQEVTCSSTTLPGAVIGLVTPPSVEGNCFWATGMRLHDASASRGAAVAASTNIAATIAEVRGP